MCQFPVVDWIFAEFLKMDMTGWQLGQISGFFKKSNLLHKYKWLYKFQSHGMACAIDL